MVEMVQYIMFSLQNEISITLHIGPPTAAIGLLQNPALVWQQDTNSDLPKESWWLNEMDLGLLRQCDCHRW